MLAGDTTFNFNNGFMEEVKTSSFGRIGTLSLKDDDGKLPLGWDGTYARHQEDLLSDESIAVNIIQRAQAQLKATTIPTGRYSVIIINRVMGKVLGPLLRPLGAPYSARSLHVERATASRLSPINYP